MPFKLGSAQLPGDGDLAGGNQLPEGPLSGRDLALHFVTIGTPLNARWSSFNCLTCDSFLGASSRVLRISLLGDLIHHLGVPDVPEGGAIGQGGEPRLPAITGLPGADVPWLTLPSRLRSKTRVDARLGTGNTNGCGRLLDSFHGFG